MPVAYDMVCVYVCIERQGESRREGGRLRKRERQRDKRTGRGERRERE